MVGTKLDGLTSIADFYATCAAIAGVDPTDHRAALAKLPPIDSINMWPYFTGVVTESPRKTIFNDVNTAINEIDGEVLTGLMLPRR
jgi:arylsulfatase B